MTELEQQLPPLEPLRDELERALAGALFPASRRALVRVARENEAPPVLLSLLAGLPDIRFDSTGAVSGVLLGALAAPES